MKNVKISRRRFVEALASVPVLGGLIHFFSKSTRAQKTLWQLDPAKCIQCGRCADFCVLTPSAVKCTHTYAMCGYCELCSGYHKPNALELNTAAENQVCPTKAINRTFIEAPFYQYDIITESCIGCGKCVSGCGAFGNGSLYLQVNQDLCTHCNECSIAAVCPSQAFKKVPEAKPYMLKDNEHG